MHSQDMMKSSLLYRAQSNADSMFSFFVQDTVSKMKPMNLDILDKIRLPDLNFVEVYNQPPREVEDDGISFDADLVRMRMSVHRLSSSVSKGLILGLRHAPRLFCTHS